MTHLGIKCLVVAECFNAGVEITFGCAVAL